MNALKNRGDHCHMGGIRASAPRGFASIVMPGLVPGIHVFNARDAKDVDGRDKPGHDGVCCEQSASML
jgi:hypothetical protein